MKKFGVLVQAETYYEIEAENADQAEEIALEYFDSYEPFTEVSEITEDEDTSEILKEYA